MAKSGAENYDREWLAHCARIGRAVVALGEAMMLESADGLVMREIRIRPPQEEGGEFLVVLKGRADGALLVAFHVAGTLDEALRGSYERLRNNQLRWRDDKFPAKEGP